MDNISKTLDNINELIKRKHTIDDIMKNIKQEEVDYIIIAIPKKIIKST